MLGLAYEVSLGLLSAEVCLVISSAIDPRLHDVIGEQNIKQETATPTLRKTDCLIPRDQDSCQKTQIVKLSINHWTRSVIELIQNVRRRNFRKLSCPDTVKSASEGEKKRRINVRQESIADGVPARDSNLRYSTALGTFWRRKPLTALGWCP